MNTQNLIDLFERDLEKLAEEVEAYQSEEALWTTDGEIKNSGGNLALHLLGNINHFIGAVLGDTGYVRDRDAEFSDKNVPKSKIINEIHDTIEMIAEVLGKLNEGTLNEKYPIEVFGKPMTVEYFILHLLSHLGYHLGQVNYHRRLLDK